ncbi:hypothetical protein GCWU000341_00125 [Oribacterium sp. oral taxon 078 str. F0262]|nr:hypothetical protein GCWU000341_00125 [Oribacterium sp. oral taxon 078 str. F0262]
MTVGLFDWLIVFRIAAAERGWESEHIPVFQIADPASAPDRKAL